MRFARAFGGKGKAPGQFFEPIGMVIVRGLVIVSEYGGKRLQVLTPKGVPLQFLALDPDFTGISAGNGEHFVWAAASERFGENVYAPAQPGHGLKVLCWSCED